MTRKEVIESLKKLTCNDHLYSIILEVDGIKVPANHIENINGTIFLSYRGRQNELSE